MNSISILFYDIHYGILLQQLGVQHILPTPSTNVAHLDEQRDS
jgi:hypothetical protein